MCKTRFPPAWPLRQAVLLLSCALLASACQHESSSLPDLPASEPIASSASLAIDDGPQTVSLSADALTPPEQPRLQIRAAPTTLILEWTPIAGQTRARLYHHDTALPGETLVHETDDARQTLLQLPSATPRTAWHREQYRLELCTSDNCVSSERMTLSGLAPATAHYLAPAVFLRGERYAEHLTLNRDASLAVIGMPLEGALEFHVRSDSRWSLTQRLRLAELPVSATRQLLLSASDSGDTIAVFIHDRNSTDPGEIRILERLGESWIQTSKLPLMAEPAATSVNASLADQPANGLEEHRQSIQLAADGSGLLLQSDNSLFISRQTETGWSSPGMLPELNNNTSHIPDSSPELASSTLSRDFTTAMALVQQNGTTSLLIWSAQQSAGDWQLTARLPLSDFSHDHELALASNQRGDELQIAGWEAGHGTARYPIMWHYAINEDSHDPASPPALTLQAISSLRAPPTSHAQASLTFKASETLDQLVLGWQLPADSLSGTLADAAVSTWRYHASSDQWLTALEMPETFPTLAKQAFARHAFLSADGSTLMMVTDSGRTQTAPGDIAEVLVLR
ncbi:hypothetical protein ACUNV4_11040 [Granulosicoccus sp. 3-233]